MKRKTSIFGSNSRKKLAEKDYDDLKLTCQQSNFVNFRKWRRENTTSVQQVSVNS